MTKQILLPPTVKAEMCKTFDADSGFLDKALKYKANGPRANMLRAAAIQRGGRVFTGQIAEPEVDRVIELFRQTCPRRVDKSCAFHDACDMSCRHGRAFQTELIIKRHPNE